VCIELTGVIECTHRNSSLTLEPKDHENSTGWQRLHSWHEEAVKIADWALPANKPTNESTKTDTNDISLE
jgi:hypothetical protein